MAQDPKDNVEFKDGGGVNVKTAGKLEYAGTAITSTAAELNILDGALFTVAELNRAADTSTRVVTSLATLAITEALHDKKVVVMADVGGDTLATYTLPAATGSGASVRFVVGVPNTSNYVITVTGDDIFYGVILQADTEPGTDVCLPYPTAADTNTITLDASTQGGLAIGDFVEATDIAADQWAVFGVVTIDDATQATPFSAV